MKKVVIASTLVLLGLANVAGAVASVQNTDSKETAVSVKTEVKLESATGVVGKPFILDGSKSQDDGTIQKFLWKQVSGPTTIKLPAVNLAKISVVPTVAGTYVFELTVTDSTGLSSVAQKVEVKAYATDPYVETAQVAPKDSDAQAGNTVRSIGDPDFDLLDISVNSDDAKKLRTESVNEGQNENWNFGDKQITDSIKTSADLKTYVDAVVLNDEAIEDVKVDKDTIEVKSKEQGKLFWFIPVTMTSNVIVKYTLSDSTADTADVSVRLPWWHFLVKKFNNDPSAVQLEIVAEIQKIEWQKVDNTDTITDVGVVSKMLQAVSNVLKTRHDTVKNSIGNIR